MTPRASLVTTSLVALHLAACGGGSSSPTPDAAADVASEASSPDTPAPGDAPAPTDTPAADGGGCEDFTGAYTITGTCSVPGFSPFPSACITQTGCAARVTVTTGPTAGTVVGNRMTFMSMVSGIPLACTATRGAGGTLTVRCEAGTVASCDATATPAAFPGATRWCCDPVAQDCGAGQRCGLVGAGANNATFLTACVPAGSVAEGAACTRVDNRLGTEMCAAGLACVNFGQATAATRACQRLCRSGADCMGDAACLVVSDTPRAGICRPRCALLGTDCPMGTCRAANVWPAMDPDTAPMTTAFACQPTGDAMEGAACQASPDCGANLTCARRSAADMFACRRVCDATHACPMGTTCTGMMSPANPTGAGACIP